MPPQVSIRITIDNAFFKVALKLAEAKGVEVEPSDFEMISRGTIFALVPKPHLLKKLLA